MSEKLPSGWSAREAESLYERLRVPIVYDKNTVRNYGKYEVIDQSQSGSIGYVDDVVFNCDSNAPLVTFANHTCAVRKMTKAFGVIQNVFPLKAKSDIDPNFLYQLLRNAVPQTGYKGHYPELREKKFMVPLKAEQKKIADILSSVDEVIENTESEIIKLEDLKKATLNELLTKGIGHTEFKDSEIGRIPKSWATSTAEGLYEKVRVQVVYDKNTVGLKGKFEVIDQSASGSIGFIEEPTFHCSDDSPLVTFANHTCAVRLMQKPFGVIQNVFPLRSKAGVDPFFLYYSLLGAIPQTAYKGHYPELREKVFAVPSSLEQKTISATICAIDQRIGAMSRRREKVLGLKKTLMQDLLTGKVRVKVN